MEYLNGFSCVIRTEGLKFEYELQDDGVGVQKYEDERIIVYVQTSYKKNDVAKMIATEYNEINTNYTPSRKIIGSFLLIDKTNKVIFVGRDRSQASHIYTLKKGSDLIISTDIRFFLNSCKILDALALDRAILGLVVTAPFPIIKGINVILPGRFIRYNSSLESVEKEFWKIQRVDVPSDYRESVQIYGNLLMKSVEACIDNNSAAVYLSGGSDSAAVMGALYKLGVENVYAAHMDIRGFFEIEGEDVRTLRDKYKFDLKFIQPNFQQRGWNDYVKKALLRGSINSIYQTFPTYQLMGRYFSEVVPQSTTVFNGEMCILDQGFNESSDKTRGLRRWLFVGAGRKLGYGLKIAPDFIKVNWDNNRKPFFDRSSWKDRFFVFDSVSRSILHSVGRPVEYFAGIKMGYRGLPGYYLGYSILPNDYKSDADRKIENFFEKYLDDMCSRDWKMAMAMLSTCWYSEASNFTMPNDTASVGGLTMCFPFSSLELMDFAASVPTEWAIDKKIQKDACKMVYDMPDSVAYRLKNHKTSFDYLNTIYGEMKEEMLETIANTDFGPLNDGIKTIIANKPQGQQIFNIYGYALWIQHYNLKVE